VKENVQLISLHDAKVVENEIKALHATIHDHDQLLFSNQFVQSSCMPYPLVLAGGDAHQP
jgi:hypothetical protein